MNAIQNSPSIFQTFFSKAENALTWNRGCVQDCEPIKGKDSWKTCCQEELCNKSPRMHAGWATMFSAVAVSTITALRRITS